METDQTNKEVVEESKYFFRGNILGTAASKLSNYVRTQLFQSICELAEPNENTRVLDVGVTSESQNEEANFFEKLYKYKHNITAVGVEDASFLEKEYPGLKFIQTSGRVLPFADDSFDLVVSLAVVEHVGTTEQQREFIEELLRVGKKVCFTTPNRWFPVEFHTGLPLVHWLPPATFRSILKSLGKDFWSTEENLHLLSDPAIRAILPKGVKVKTRHFRLAGMISNLLFYLER